MFPEDTPPRSILVIKFRNIGDVLLTTPVFANLRAAYPEARICALVNSGTEEMLTGNPVMRQGNSQVTGIRVIYFIEQDRSIAEGDSKIRVRATIFPEELQNLDKGDSAAGK